MAGSAFEVGSLWLQGGNRIKQGLANDLFILFIFVCVSKSFMGTQPHPFSYILSLVALTLWVELSN